MLSVQNTSIIAWLTHLAFVSQQSPVTFTCALSYGLMFAIWDLSLPTSEWRLKENTHLLNFRMREAHLAVSSPRSVFQHQGQKIAPSKHTESNTCVCGFMEIAFPVDVQGEWAQEEKTKSVINNRCCHHQNLIAPLWAPWQSNGKGQCGASF